MTRDNMFEVAKQARNNLISLVAEFDLCPKDVFTLKNFDFGEIQPLDTEPPPSKGCPKFAEIDPLDENTTISDTPVLEKNTTLHDVWHQITTQLVEKITNPHLDKNGVEAVFREFGVLAELYIRKFRSA